MMVLHRVADAVRRIRALRPGCIPGRIPDRLARRLAAGAWLTLWAIAIGAPAATLPGTAARDAGAPAVVGPEAALRAARVAATAGDADRVAALAPQLAGHPLEAYPAYWEASVRLHAANPDDSGVRPFLERHPGTVLADRLRAEWLLVLAGRGDFDTFDAERRLLVTGGDEAQLKCDTLLSRYVHDSGRRLESVLREARSQLAQVAEPGGDGCSALADRLLDDGALTVPARLQVLVERNQITPAEKVAARLPGNEAADVRQLLEQPANWLRANQAGAAFADRPEHSLALLALQALGRDAPDEAARFAEALDASFSADERALVWGRIGRSAQFKLLPQAHDWFVHGGAPALAGLDVARATELLEARARADLRRGSMAEAGSAPGAVESAPGSAPIPGPGPDWDDLRRTIALMPPALQADSTWTYWKAQSLLAQGQAEEARAGLRAIAGRFSYYGRLAAEQLGLPLELAPRPPAPEAARVDELALRPGFDRARRLFDLGLREEAMREWSWELRGMDDATLHAAAELGRRMGVLDRMILSSESMHATVDLGQRYPLPYPDLMTAICEPLGMDPAWIYGLIRQESRFMEDIKSNAGAIGLMQLMPTTARYVAHRIGFQNYRSDRIGEVAVNLRLGTEYLKMVLDDQDGQPLLASAAYNAGPHRVRKWRAALARPLDGAIFVETIPINETRDYVKKVLFNTVVYDRMLQHSAVALRTLLGPVSPKAPPASDLP